MIAALRGSVRAQWRTSRVPTAVDGARPRPARNSEATPSYPLDRSIISGLLQFLEPNGLRYAPHGSTGYCVSTLVRAGGWDWAPSRRSPGTRQRHFDGTSLKPNKLPENAHAALRHFWGNL